MDLPHVEKAAAKICPFVVIARRAARARSETLQLAAARISRSARRYLICSQPLTRKCLCSDAGHFLAMHKPGNTAEIEAFFATN
jgi:hypothetical protein